MDEKTRDLIIDLCEGNPGALTVLIQAVEMFGTGAVDEIAKVDGLRGPEIWMLYKDENDQNIARFFTAVLKKSGFAAKVGIDG